ncbi:MAG: Stp1/IreP family PP2C-type Ser/Thr phosphatase [Gudongella sp.]|nr:Stp1/IreP family PP2C-type Ser/Thr phosphatase [Gudongella sp.]
MIIGGGSNKGLVREINQDCMYIARKNCLPLFIVADGMGGHKAGEIASKLTVDIVRKDITLNASKISNQDEVYSTIKKAIELANSEVYNYSLSHSECNGMGTTVTLGYVYNNNYFIVAHVGDSRAYYLRNKHLIKITEDHSLVNELIKTGEITRSEALTHPQRNVILRAVGTSPEIDIDIYSIEIKKEDIFIICSDGLTNMIDEPEIQDIFEKTEDIENACELAIESAINKGGKDNITVIGIRF